MGEGVREDEETRLRDFCQRQVAYAGPSSRQGACLACVGILAQLYPPPEHAEKVNKLVIQKLLHLPHHGLPPPVLRSLGTFGLIDLLPLDVFIEASSVLADTRLGEVAGGRL
jgi:hypothetical protein